MTLLSSVLSYDRQQRGFEVLYVVSEPEKGPNLS